MTILGGSSTEVARLALYRLMLVSCLLDKLRGDHHFSGTIDFAI